MSKIYEWAKDYQRARETSIDSMSNVIMIRMWLDALAEAIINDVHGDKP